MSGLVVDTSVIVAILSEESGWQVLFEHLERTEAVLLSAASFVECCIVLQRSRFQAAALQKFNDLLSTLAITVVPVTEPQARVAAEAYATYGKGRHPAALNFGDCFSYALARHLNQPLLFKGDDFRQTDVLIAQPA